MQGQVFQRWLKASPNNVAAVNNYAYFLVAQDEPGEALRHMEQLKRQASDTPDYKLSKNQKKFVADAEKQGFEVDYSYSGRFMFGKLCPAVRCNVGEFGTQAEINTDNMGLGVVIYARE